MLAFISGVMGLVFAFSNVTKVIEPIQACASIGKGDCYEKAGKVMEETIP
jgi:hypothetical protein